MKKSRLGLLLFLVAIVAWLGVVRAQINQFSDKLMQAKVKQVEVSSYDQRLDDITKIKANGEAIQGTLKALYLAMPKSSQVPETLVMMESLGNGAGVVFGTASVGLPAGTEVPVAISFNGNLDSVNKFLNALNSNIRTATVKSQFINADVSGNLTVTLQLGLVYQGGL